MNNWPTADSGHHPAPLPGHGHPAPHLGHGHSAASAMGAIAPPRPEDFPCPRYVNQSDMGVVCQTV